MERELPAEYYFSASLEEGRTVVDAVIKGTRQAVSCEMRVADLVLESKAIEAPAQGHIDGCSPCQRLAVGVARQN